MKKRLLAIVIICTMAISLSACGGSGGNSGSESKSGNISTAASDTASQSGASQTSSAAQADTASIRSGKDVYDFYDKLTTAMEKKLTDLQNQHNDAVGDDYTAMVNILYTPFNALRYLDLIYFGDGGAAAAQSTLRALGNEDAVVTENGTNSFTIEYTAKSYNADSTTTTYKSKADIKFDTEKLVFSIVFYRDGKLSNFTEAQFIGKDQYAFSTETDRAIVTYKDGEVTAFVHAENTYEDDYENGGFTKESFIYEYNDESKVFGKQSVDEAWVKEAEKHDALHRLYVLKDNVIKITGLKDKYTYDGPKTYEPGYDVTLP